VDSRATMRDDFEYGNISIVCADPGSDTYVDYRCDYELWDVESGIFLYLTCNKNSAVFSNKAIRVALTHAIDRDALVKEYYRGFAMSAYLPASPDSPQYNASAEEIYGLNGDIFAQAVTDAALENMAITLLVNKADSRRVKVAHGIAKMLETYGFTVTVSALSDSSYTNALKNGKFDLHLGQTKLSANMDLTAFFDPDGALSLGGVADTAAFTLALGAMENDTNYAHLYKRVMSNGILCPVLFRTYAIYVQRGLFDELTPARDHIFYYDLGRTLESAKLQ
jgi:peptide/nickel transport system substrate-binding protein